MILSSVCFVIYATKFPRSHSPCAVPMTGVSRPFIYIGCRNIITLSDVGDQITTIRTLCDFQVCIAGLSEDRLGGTNSRYTKIPGPDSRCWFCHSETKNPGQQGVAVSLSHGGNYTTLMATDIKNHYSRFQEFSDITVLFSTVKMATGSSTSLILTGST